MLGWRQARGLDASISLGVVRFCMRFQMLVGVKRLVATFMITAIRLSPWRAVNFADVSPELVMLGESLLAPILRACKQFGSVVPILVCF